LNAYVCLNCVFHENQSLSLLCKAWVWCTRRERCMTKLSHFTSAHFA
jgi:hypothetical protein